MENTIFQCKVGRDELVVREIPDAKGDKIDFRIWYYNDDDELCPTKKGFRVKKDKFINIINDLHNLFNEEV